MPAKGTTRVTEAQRLKIAAGKLTGKTHQEIAGETGLSQSAVNKQAIDKRTQSLIQALKREDEVALKRIWGKAMKRLEADVDSNDPDIRRHGRGQFFRLLTAGEAALKIDPGSGGGGDFTLQELLVVYRRASVGS